MTSTASLFIPSVPDAPGVRIIDVTDLDEVGYWTETLGVSETELRLAVAAVGSSLQEVRDHLGK